MQSSARISKLKEKINELEILMEDFINYNRAKKNRIRNLESEIEDLKHKINNHLDDLEELIDQK